MCRKLASFGWGVVGCHPVCWFVWAGDGAGGILGCESGYRWNVVDRVKIKKNEVIAVFFDILCYIWRKRSGEAVKYLCVDDYRKRMDGKRKGN